MVLRDIIQTVDLEAPKIGAWVKSPQILHKILLEHVLLELVLIGPVDVAGVGHRLNLLVVFEQLRQLHFRGIWFHPRSLCVLQREGPMLQTRAATEQLRI